MKVKIEDLVLGYSELTGNVYIHNNKGEKKDVTEEFAKLSKVVNPPSVDKTLSPETVELINSILSRYDPNDHYSTVSWEDLKKIKVEFKSKYGQNK